MDIKKEDQKEINKINLDEEISESGEGSHPSSIENSKNESVNQIQLQINEITKLTLSKVASFEVTDDEIQNAVKDSERSLN